MSKKTKDSVNEYFSHDYHARNDPKLQKLQAKMGHEGKGIYWDIIELLYEQAGKLLVSEIETYAFSIRCEKIAFQNVISDFDLFINDGEYFWSESVLRRLCIRSVKSASASKSARIRWKKTNANALPTHSERTANALPTQSDRNAIKEKKRILKNIKEKDIKENKSKVEAREHFFKDSEYFLNKEKWHQDLPPEWSTEKKEHYWAAAEYWSSEKEKNKKKDWVRAVVQWDRNKPFEEKQPPGPKPKETPAQTDDITRIIDEFNALTQSQYDPKDEAIRGFIAGRLMDGCQLQDMLDVIALKAVQWGSGDSRKFLKFHTLFRVEKYPGYVQEVRDAKAGKIKVHNENETPYERYTRFQRGIDNALAVIEGRQPNPTEMA